jgi:very-short-patch-repair endonuclease
MPKIDIICKIYNLERKNNLIAIDDIKSNVLRKTRMTKLLSEIQNIQLINNKEYITENEFQLLCQRSSFYKTDEINYILNNDDLDFEIITFENQPIHIIIKDNIKYYRYRDLTTIINYSDKSAPINLISQVNKKQVNELLNTNICTLFAFDSNTYFITKEGVKSILLKSRKSADLRNKLAKELDITINLEEDKYIAKETQFCDIIKKALPNDTKIINQYVIDNYFIDMYLPDYKLAIECDEFNHSKYDTEKDKEREEYIKNKLGCQIIRFNPDNKNFCVYTLIKDIYAKILNLDNQVIPQKIEELKGPKITVKKSDPLKNKCIDCDEKIYKNNQRCIYCYNKKKFHDNCVSTNRPTYQVLIDNVKQYGKTKTGKMYGVSDNSINKWIKTYEKYMEN